MVQVLENVPSFKSQLGRALGGTISSAVSSGLEGYKEGREAKSFKEKYGFDAPREGREEFHKAFGKKRGEALGSQIQSPGGEHPIQGVFDEMSMMLKQDLPGIGKFNYRWKPEALEHSGAFDAMRARIESVLVPMVNTGQLSNTRFNYIMSTIPQANEMQSSIAGKLRGLAKALSDEGIEVDTSILNSIPWASKDLKELETKTSKARGKSQKLKQISPDVVDQLLDEAGNDVKKAKKLAADRGYTW